MADITIILKPQEVLNCFRDYALAQLSKDQRDALNTNGEITIVRDGGVGRDILQVEVKFSELNHRGD